MWMKSGRRWPPAAGGFVVTVLPEVGTYPFVSHVMVDADRGARGIIRGPPPESAGYGRTHPPIYHI